MFNFWNIKYLKLHYSFLSPLQQSHSDSNDHSHCFDLPLSECSWSVQQAGQVCPQIRFLSIWCQNGFPGLFRDKKWNVNGFLYWLTFLPCGMFLWLCRQPSVVLLIFMIRSLSSAQVQLTYVSIIEMSLFSHNSSLPCSFVSWHLHDDCFVWSLQNQDLNFVKSAHYVLSFKCIHTGGITNESICF